METLHLPTLARDQLEAARATKHGRSTHGIVGGHGHTLRQILVAVTAGNGLAEHDNPGEATLQVIHGRVRLTAGEHDWQGGPGDYLVIPNRRHDVTAIEDAVFLLTVTIGPKST